MPLPDDGHPQHRHRTPCEFAEDEILAALRGEPYQIGSGPHGMRFNPDEDWQGFVRERFNQRGHSQTPVRYGSLDKVSGTGR